MAMKTPTSSLLCATLLLGLLLALVPGHVIAARRVDITDTGALASRWGDMSSGAGAGQSAVNRSANGTLTETARVSIEPVTSTVQSGETFTVSVVIFEAVNLGAFQFEMHYDPAVVHAEEATPGPFLGSSGRNVLPVPGLPTIDNDAGRLAFGAFSFGTQPGPDGRGALAKATIIAQRAGSSALDLQAVVITDPEGQEQPVTVTDGAAMVKRSLYLPLILRSD